MVTNFDIFPEPEPFHFVEVLKTKNVIIPEGMTFRFKVGDIVKYKNPANKTTIGRILQLLPGKKTREPLIEYWNVEPTYLVLLFVDNQNGRGVVRRSLFERKLTKPSPMSYIKHWDKYIHLHDDHVVRANQYKKK